MFAVYVICKSFLIWKFKIDLLLHEKISIYGSYIMSQPALAMYKINHAMHFQQQLLCSYEVASQYIAS